MENKTANVSIPLWGLIVSMCIGVAAGTWALSAETHNYRLQNITSRLQSHESMLIEKIRRDASQDLMIDHNRTLLESLVDDIAEIKEAVVK